MSTYEYKCRQCGHEFEQVMTIEQHEKFGPQCPKCDSKKVESVFSTFFAKTDSKA